MEFLGIRCLVEIEVTAEQLIRAFTRQHHLDAHRLDDAGQQVHQGGSSDRGHIIRLDVIDDVAQGIKPS